MWSSTSLSLPTPSVGAISDFASTSTGSVLIDGSIGGVMGALIAPVAKQRLAYALGGAVLGGLGGLLGIGLLAGYAIARMGR